MRLRGSVLRCAAVAMLAMATGMFTGAAAQATSTTGPQASSTTGPQANSTAGPRADVNPYSPAYRHPYRHGALPSRGQLTKMRQWTRSHPVRPAAATTSPDDLNYGGGIDGIGVTTGHEKVYLVLYGSDWGATSTDGNGDLTAAGDAQGEAPYLQQLMKGLGTGGELWSGVMTQYCEGVAVGAQACPASGGLQVAYPAGGALAGVWADESAPSPSSATGNQLGQEAVTAAAHFGNTTAASNRDAQYVIMSPTGTDPDGWLENGFCAWHDYTGDTTLTGGAVSSPYGDIAFTNLPYITDAGSSCGQDFVNSDGNLDGVSIVEGHEYAETITDQNPAGGWTDTSGEETGDKCAWGTPGSDGGAFDLTTTTGSFAMQTTWANDGAGGAGSCEAAHAVVASAGESTVTVTSPGNPSSQLGKATSLQLQATDSTAGQILTYSATGLPPGLSVSRSGLISGTPAAVGSFAVTVIAVDSTGMPGSAAFTWNVTNPGGGIVNGGFETGSFFGWVTTGPASIVSSGQHSGSHAAQAGSTDPDGSESDLTQTFTVPAADGKLTFWYNQTCGALFGEGWATATLADNTTGATSTPLQQVCDTSSGWTPVIVPVTAGDSYTLTLTNQGDGIFSTYAVFDDVTLAPAGPNPVKNGGFEAGTFTGWVTGGPATSIVSSGQNSGNFAAQAGSVNGSNGTSTIAQTFTAAAGDSALTFWFNVSCQSFNSGDGASATLTDNTAGTTSSVLDPDCPFINFDYAQVTAALTPGHSYTLTLANTDTMNSADFPTYTLFDDVSVY